MYATADDITLIYGQDALLAAQDDDGVVDPARVERACRSATEEINSYLAGRYKTPLSQIPGRIRDVAVDVAVYRLSQTADLLTDEIRQRYEDAISWLNKVAAGKVDAGVPRASGAAGDPVVVAGSDKLFTREKMKGF